jgi:hypothetical protein
MRDNAWRLKASRRTNLAQLGALFAAMQWRSFNGNP